MFGFNIETIIEELNQYIQTNVSKIIHFYLKYGESFQIGPSPKQEHKFRQAYVLSLRSSYKTWFGDELTKRLNEDIEITENKLIYVFKHAHSEGIFGEV